MSSINHLGVLQRTALSMATCPARASAILEVSMLGSTQKCQRCAQECWSQDLAAAWTCSRKCGSLSSSNCREFVFCSVPPLSTHRAHRLVRKKNKGGGGKKKKKKRLGKRCPVCSPPGPGSSPAGSTPLPGMRILIMFWMTIGISEPEACKTLTLPVTEQKSDGFRKSLCRLAFTLAL